MNEVKVANGVGTEKDSWRKGGLNKGVDLWDKGDWKLLCVTEADRS